MGNTPGDSIAQEPAKVLMLHRDLIREMQSCFEVTSRLVHRMLDRTRLFASSELQNEKMISLGTDAGCGLRDAVAVLHAKASQRSVAVCVGIREELPQVYAYPAELKQIWGILIDNALDAAPDSGRVDISACCEMERVVVRVVDDGAGVPVEIRSRIFDPFFTTKPLGQGTGLGLDIARRLVRHNEGMIEFDSEPGKTEFRVSFPVANADSYA